MISKKAVYIYLLLLVALFSFVGGPGVPIQPVMANGQLEEPVCIPRLTAAITSPANMAVIPTATYLVSASVTASGGCSLCNVTLTLAVTGPATVQGATTMNIATMASGQTLSFVWLVNCTGNGNVTFTITPGGIACPIVASWSPVVYAAGMMSPGWDTQRFTGTALLSPPVIVIVPASITVVHQCGGSIGSESPSSGPGGTYGYSAPAQVVVTSINTQPQLAAASQPISIMANVANRGEAKGNYNATLKINGEVVEVKSGSLSGNTARPVEFTVYRDKPGTYLVDVNGRQASFTITGSGQPAPMDPRVIVIVVLSVLALAIIVILIKRLSTR